jgi:hypothetical protein
VVLTSAQRKVLEEGSSAFKRELAFSEIEALNLLAPYIKNSLKFDVLDILSAKEAMALVGQEGQGEAVAKEKVESAEPGSPSTQFWNSSA